MFRFFDFSPIIGEKIQINDIEAYATEVSTRRQVEIFKRNLYVSVFPSKCHSN